MEAIMNGLGVGQAGGSQTSMQNPVGGLIGQGFNYLSDWWNQSEDTENYYDPNYDYGTGFGSSGFEGTGGI